MENKTQIIPPPPDSQTAQPDLVPPADSVTEARVAMASQWQLMWWRFRKHKFALVSGVIVVLTYLVAALVEPIAPFDPEMINQKYPFAPPQRLHFFDNGKFAPFVYDYKVVVNLKTYRREFTDDLEKKIPIQLFSKGEPYKLWGLITADIHLFKPEDPQQFIYLLGADRLGRDMFSRIVYGTRISMSIGLIGVFLSLFLGILLGGVSGLYGGKVDNLIQRLIEFFSSMPRVPLWMGLAAAIPLTWRPTDVYFLITIILSLLNWPGLARTVRGRFLSIKTEDYVTAAWLDGAKQIRIIFKHMLPAMYSHIIASMTLSIPGMILAETALSFLGLGLRPPVISWGVLLQEANDLRSVALAPWLLSPAIAIMITVLTLNFLGDGLRDAADPYGQG
jgi:peptide/nickel transport system permease protein